jgi:hypothetical protein
MTGKAIHDGQKYFFNENIFDDGHTDEPPPPSFSEQQLADAQTKILLPKGVSKALKEAEDFATQTHRSEFSNKIRKQLVTLTAAEAQREKIVRARNAGALPV